MSAIYDIAKCGWDVWCRMETHPGQAAWAQAIGSLIGLAAAIGFPLWLRHNDRRLAADGRLRLVARHSPVRGIEVLISFEPDSLQSGLEARVKVKQPTGAILIPEERKATGVDAPMISGSADIANAARFVTMRLKHLPGEPKGVYMGSAHVTSGDDRPEPTSAMLVVEVWTDSDPRCLARRKATVSPIS